MNDGSRERIYAATNLADAAVRANQAGLGDLSTDLERAARQLLEPFQPARTGGDATNTVGE